MACPYLNCCCYSDQDENSECHQDPYNCRVFKNLLDLGLKEAVEFRNEKGLVHIIGGEDAGDKLDTL